ncbi:MAG TPA: hypothetical protein VFN03_02970 [Trueperaceae bacterium]|nr:hypothetical protein [Trueperaceae bacterium]
MTLVLIVGVAVGRVVFVRPVVLVLSVSVLVLPVPVPVLGSRHAGTVCLSTRDLLATAVVVRAATGSSGAEFEWERRSSPVAC